MRCSHMSIGSRQRAVKRARVTCVVNEKGGVNGRKLELVSVEYGFQPPRAVAAYKKFVEEDKVLLVLGYGTPDTEALRPFITKDKVPYLSGSYSGHLTDPRHTPYNFPGGIDYTSQIRIFLNYVKETWTDKSRKPRVAFIYADNAYGRAPIEQFAMGIQPGLPLERFKKYAELFAREVAPAFR